MLDTNYLINAASAKIPNFCQNSFREQEILPCYFNTLFQALVCLLSASCLKLTHARIEN